MTLLQDLGLVETIAGDLIAFANGATINKTQNIGGKEVNVSIAILGANPSTSYATFTGSLLSMFELGLTLGAAFSARTPVAIQEKIGNTWYGETLQLAEPPTAG